MIRPISDLLWSPFSPFPPNSVLASKLSDFDDPENRILQNFQMVSMTRETREGTKKVKQTQDKECGYNEFKACAGLVCEKDLGEGEVSAWGRVRGSATARQQ